MKPTKFGRNLKKLMVSMDMSQTDLAQKTGVTGATISYILSGKCEPTLGTICAILKVIPVKFEKLVGEL